jgi:hypothetical protein
LSYRLQKALGYGFVDVKTDGHGRASDERINSSSFILDFEVFIDKYEDSAEAFEDYIDFIKNNNLKTDLDSISFLEEAKNNKVSVDSALTYNFEYGLDSVLCITPFSQLHRSDPWKRSGNTLDAYEAQLTKGDQWDKPVLEIIPGGIYPFLGIYVDKRTWRNIRITEVDSWNRLNKECEEMGYVSEYMEPKMDEAAKRAGFETWQEARENLVEAPPNDIVNLIRWSGLLTDEKYLLEIKPMLYTYWS